jgi:hypothetical protein
MDEETIVENLNEDVGVLVPEQDWSLQTIWNNFLAFGNDRELKPRTEIWASEIGKNYYERYLKMTGVKPDLQYPLRVLRVFSAGRKLEREVAEVFIAAGLLKHDNKKYTIKGDGITTVDVGVRPDFICGGVPDWQKVQENLDRLAKEATAIYEDGAMNTHLAEVLLASKNLTELLKKKFPKGLNDLLYEIKSVNSMLFWAKKDYLKDAYPHHVMQTYTGMKATGLKEGRLFYVSKDDRTCLEFPIYATQALEEAWEKDVREMSAYILKGEVPPKPESIVFDKRKKINFQKNKVKYSIQGAYTANWEIERSMYLPTITGFENKEEWLKSLKEEIKARNDALKDDYIIQNNL